MSSNTEQATLEETLEFANKVRAAGGGNPIEALIPAIPHDSKNCLIARNLNFNCYVRGLYRQEEELLGIHPEDPDYGSRQDNTWVMQILDKDVRDKIAVTLGLLTLDTEYGGRAVVLPDSIGQVARNFDIAGDFGDQDKLDEFLPFIDASTTEIAENDGIIKDGKLVL